MKIILLERIAKLGQMGDVVTVKDGFARNYLLPQGKALRATDANSAKFDEQRVELEARNLERKSEAESVKDKLDGTSYISIRSAGQTGQLYGSVSTRDIAETLDEAGFKVARNQVNLLVPIKVIGLHDVQVILHPEVTSDIIINVARSDDEAERQAAGEDLTGRDSAFEHDVYDHEGDSDDGDDGDEVDLDEVFENPEDAEAAAAGDEDETSTDDAPADEADVAASGEDSKEATS